MPETARTKVIVDTDIADDIDDAIALAFLLGSPEFEILGVTTVYGDVETRAKVARRLCRSWGRGDIPVVMGFERPMGYDWFPGTVPESPPSQHGAVAGEPPLEDCTRSAVEFICRTVRRYPGEVYLLTLGAMTNVGAALCVDPQLATLAAGVVSQAGTPPPAEPRLDWNTAYDVLAAQSIARSGVPWTCIGGGATGRNNNLQRAEFDALAASNLPAVEVLLDLVVHMKRYKKGQDPSVRTIADVPSASICDVGVPASFLVPEQMDLRPARIEIDTTIGCPRITPDPAGPHRYAAGRIAEGTWRAEMLRRFLSAPRRV